MLNTSRTLISLCMLSLLLSQLALHLRSITRLSADASDALGGFFIGVAIVLLALAARARRHHPPRCA
jgi:uncharacterized membrane protein YidH (DUF202 family)